MSPRVYVIPSNQQLTQLHYFVAGGKVLIEDRVQTRVVEETVQAVDMGIIAILALAAGRGIWNRGIWIRLEERWIQIGFQPHLLWIPERGEGD